MIDLPVKLCSWQRKCVFAEGFVQGQHANHDGVICLKCHGTGLTYVLDDSVRVQCAGAHINEEKSKLVNWVIWELCQAHGCPGWTPSTDLAVWLEAAASLYVVDLYTWGREWVCVLRNEELQILAEARAKTVIDALQSALTVLMEKICS